MQLQLIKFLLLVVSGLVVNQELSGFLIVQRSNQLWEQIFAITTQFTQFR